jgi:hypothetical protein
MTITLRSTKGTALTYSEMDENFRDLRFDTTLQRAATNGNTITGNISVTGKVIYPGAVLQVVHTSKTNSFTGTSVVDNGGYFVDVTGLSATITPTQSTSRILILTNLYIGTSMTSGSGYQNTMRIKRTIGGVTAFPILGDAEGGRPRATGRINFYIAGSGTTLTYHMGMMSGVHQDSPATTSAITYQIQMGGYSSAPIVYLNRSETWGFAAGDYDNVPVSTLTLMEIAT